MPVGRQVNYSMMVGAIISWGIAWPLLRNRAGDWYPANLANPANNFQGEFAYHVSALSARRACCTDPAPLLLLNATHCSLLAWCQGHPTLRGAPGA